MSVMLYPCVLLCSCVCLFCVMRVCELFGETIRNVFGFSCYFVVFVFSVMWSDLVMTSAISCPLWS